MERESVFTRPCAMCGKLIEYTYATKRTRYCEECKKEAYAEKSRYRGEEYRARQQVANRADRIAHQQDTSVWVFDYGERQKARTLEMLGSIQA